MSYQECLGSVRSLYTLTSSSAPRLNILLQNCFSADIYKLKFVVFSTVKITTGHDYGLYKPRCSSNIRKKIITDKVVTSYMEFTAISGKLFVLESF